jgi:hypothetical protein
LKCFQVAMDITDYCLHYEILPGAEAPGGFHCQLGSDEA